MFSCFLNCSTARRAGLTLVREKEQSNRVSEKRKKEKEKNRLIN